MRIPRTGLRFVVIGAGMSGILAAIKLREAGFHDVVLYEKAERLGGTWRKNTDPGLTCDVPSHFYSYSFALNPEWSHRYAPGGEILAYLENVARRHGVEPLIRYRKQVSGCAFEAGRWRLTTADGGTDEADFVIAATGVLHHPRYPDIEGLGTFGGPCFHSARWDHGVALAGKRVGVVGTGSSAIQIVTALAGRVGELRLFQRTAQWIAPSTNPAYTEEEKATFRRNPAAMEAIRQETARAFIEGFANVLVDANSPMLAAIHAGCKAHLETSVRDPVLREKLRPTYRAACKRLIISDGFYEAIQHPTVTLVTEGIGRDRRLRAANDRTRPLRGGGRRRVGSQPFAHLAVGAPDVSHFVLLNGPNRPAGNFSPTEVAERKMGYVTHRR